MEVEDREPDGRAGSPGEAEQTSVSEPTDSPQQAAALCSTTLLQETLAWKADHTYCYETAAVFSHKLLSYHYIRVVATTESIKLELSQQNPPNSAYYYLIYLPFFFSCWLSSTQRIIKTNPRSRPSSSLHSTVISTGQLVDFSTLVTFGGNP